MSDELTIEIETTPADRVAFRKHVVRQVQDVTAARRARRRLWSAGVVVVVGGLGGFLAGRHGGERTPMPWLEAVLLAGTFVLFFLFFYVGDMVDRQAAVFADADARLPTRATYVFGPEGVRYRLVDREGILRWAGIMDLDETPEHFFVMHSLAQGWVLPKRLLSGPEADVLRKLFEDVRKRGETGAS